MTDLQKRVADLETAVIALGITRTEELGDSPGHPFRGNQHKGVGGGMRTMTRADQKRADESAEGDRRAGVEGGKPSGKSAEYAERRDTFRVKVDASGKASVDDVDWALEGESEAATVADAKKTAKRYGIEAVSTGQGSSGGGWPTINFHGPADKIDKFLEDYENGDTGND
jgi:hypothetical protein